MQTPFKTSLKIFLSILLINSFSTTISLQAQTIKLNGDAGHSNVGFSVSLAGGLTRITGKFNEFDIGINYVDNDITKSSIQANIKSATINTGIAGRDEHLTKPDFFDAAKYPLITFVSDSIRKTDNEFIAYGSFTMHGITKKIKLPFQIVGKNPEGAIGFSARYKLSRRDFQIGKDTLKPAADGYISDEVLIEIDFIAEKPETDK